MALKKREKILTGVTGVLLVAALVPLLSGGSGTLGELRQNRDELRSLVSGRERQLDRLQKARARLVQWQKRALPADRELASTLYQTWLRDLVARAGLEAANVDPSQAQSQRGAYWRLQFTITAQGNLRQLTRLLWDFYCSNCLHRIRRLTITPLGDPDKLGLFLLIEALSLPESEQKDKLPQGKSDRLAQSPLSTLEEYCDVIVRRRMEGQRYEPSGGLFAVYAPARPEVVDTGPADPPPPRPKPPGFDLAQYTVVSGITAEDGRPRVWIHVRPEDEMMLRREGDSFKIGELTGTVEKIDPLWVSVVFDGERRRIRLGKSLQDPDEKSTLPPEPESPKPDSPEPESPKPESPEPESPKPESEDPQTQDPVAGEPTPDQTEEEERVAEKTETEGPPADKPDVTPPDADQPNPEEPDTGKTPVAPVGSAAR